MSQKIDPQAVYNLEMVFMIFLGVQGDLRLSDGSAACKESDARYGGIIILILKDFSEDSPHVERQ